MDILACAGSSREQREAARPSSRERATQNFGAMQAPLCIRISAAAWQCLFRDARLVPATAPPSSTYNRKIHFNRANAHRALLPWPR